MKTLKILTVSLLVLSFFFTSCRKELNEIDQGKPQSMSDLKVSANFNWQTTRELKPEYRVKPEKHFNSLQ